MVRKGLDLKPQRATPATPRSGVLLAEILKSREPEILASAVVLSAPPTEILNTENQNTQTNTPSSSPRSDLLDDLKCLLHCVAADRDAMERRRVLEAIKTIDPGEAGLQLARTWCSRSSHDQELHEEWDSGQVGSSAYEAARLLKRFADKADHQPGAPLDELWESIESALRPEVTPNRTPPIQEVGLAKYSLLHQVAELERAMVEQRPCLGSIALFGQASVIYAKPNTGKTLIVLHLMCEAIKSKRLEPSKLFYINMDDNGAGLVEKGRLSEEYGFHMLADGYRDFQARTFREHMVDMTQNGTAQGTVIVLDTLKKFVNTMDKGKSSEFTKDARRFVMRGGTVVALSHTNKKPGIDGKAIYAGTSDFVDDFDCAYVVSTLTEEDGEKVVEFENIKRRGDVAL